MSSVMISFAQAASYFRGTGGPILYAQTAFGPFAGFQIGWILYVGRVTSLAANGNLLATYLGGYVDGADEGVGRVAVLGVLTATVSAWGTRSARVVRTRRGASGFTVLPYVEVGPW